MPRQPRIDIEEGFYHVLNRGVEKRVIFQEPRDYEKFLDTLEKLVKELKFSVFCYVLLPNHFHLSLQTKNHSLSKIIGRLLTSYAVYFNKKNKRVGPLFQDRFKSKLVEKERYFLALSRYIHLNPVSSGMVKDPIDYPYSSFQEIFSQGKWNIVDRNNIDMIISDFGLSLDKYKKFIYQSIEDIDNEEIFEKDPFNSKEDILGSDYFNTRNQRKFIRSKKKQ